MTKHSEVHDQGANTPHQAKLSHELIAGAASYAAMKSYNEYQAEHGNPVSHAKAKEILAGLGGALVDRMIETKGLDALEKAKAKHHADESHENHHKGHHH